MGPLGEDGPVGPQGERVSWIQIYITYITFAFLSFILCLERNTFILLNLLAHFARHVPRNAKVNTLLVRVSPVVLIRNRWQKCGICLIFDRIQ